ncbi:MAG: alpha/beta-type small acid-soluble spore protein [Oscillospiraceae bacterium]|jgi:small acid-soluble spore protein D (minor alpha/beta-type SASP)|nr:alpha/beta-type small acid-soluble spore protein [Oscillospiraceae bacterium]
MARKSSTASKSKSKSTASKAKSTASKASAALSRYKTEAASEVGVNLKSGSKSKMTKSQAGKIGGLMVKKMVESCKRGSN